MLIRGSKCVVGLIFGITVFIPPTETNAQSFMDKLKSAAEKVAPNVAVPSPQSGGGASALSLGDITSGLKEALRVGAERVVGKIGASDGYNKDPAIHIPLPDQLQSVQSTLRNLACPAWRTMSN